MKKLKFISFILLLFMGCSLEAQDKEDRQSKSSKIESILDAVKVGKEINENSWFIDIYKDTMSFSSLKNKWVLIDYWSMGCIPCVKEFPAIESFYAESKNDIAVIAINVDKDFKSFKKGYKKYNLAIPNYYGGFNFGNSLFAMNVNEFVSKNGEKSYRTSVPQYVLINPQRIIVDKDFPKPSSPEFKSKLKEYMD